MKSCLKIISSFVTALSLLAFPLSPVFAAAPDGLGPWADFVVSANQANTKSGVPVSVVNPARSNPNAALGVAENDTVDSHFFSLGFGGSITLGFDNGIRNGVLVVESTNLPYPPEKAKVELSENGVTWFDAGTLVRSGQVGKPDGLTCAKFARITDVSNVNDFSEPTADGYDVDGVKALGDPCTPPVTGGTCGCSNITQTNVTDISTTIVSVANTGNNKVNKNTGGSQTITTGDASSVVNVSTTGGTNTATGSGCCCKGSTTAIISGNGTGSINTITIKNGPSRHKFF